MHDFQDLLILLATIWTAGALFKQLSLPQVFGEMLAGLIIGPAMLNLVDADSEMIRTLSELGIFFLMLHTGLKSDHKELLKIGGKAFAIAAGGMALSFGGGFAAAKMFGFPDAASLFIGTGLSVSAIPLAVRLFKEYGLEDSPAAKYTTAAMLINEILALILFAVILGSVQGGFDVILVAALTAKAVIFLVAVICAGIALSPLLHRVIYKGNKGFTFTLIISLLIGIIAESIGLHVVIGAFFAGLFIRQEVIDDETFLKIEDRIYGLSYSFFGPIFFASLAFHFDFAAVMRMPLFITVACVAAVAGKAIGSGGAAYLCGLSGKQSLIIASAMNNRGAVELVMASTALATGVIDGAAFSVLVIVALITTMLSTMTLRPLAKSS